MLAGLAAQEGEERLRAFAEALERGDLTLASSAGALQATLGLGQPRLRSYREVLLSASTVPGLVLAIRAAAATAAIMAARQPRIEVAWTYPGAARPGLRTTGGVAREIIDGSRLSLLLVGYRVTVDPALSGLAAQTVDAIARAAGRGVVVTAVLDRAANRDALLRTWRPGVSQPSIFTWPRSDDDKAAVHAKLLIADRTDGLLTSANLTYHGFERNIEIGIRVSGSAAGEIHDRMHELISAGNFVPWLE